MGATSLAALSVSTLPVFSSSISSSLPVALYTVCTPPAHVCRVYPVPTRVHLPVAPRSCILSGCREGPGHKDLPSGAPLPAVRRLAPASAHVPHLVHPIRPASSCISPNHPDMAATLSGHRPPRLVRNVSFPVLMSSLAPPSPSRPPHVPRVSSFTSMANAYSAIRPPVPVPHPHPDADGLVPQLLPHLPVPVSSPPSRLSPLTANLFHHHPSEPDPHDLASSSDNDDQDDEEEEEEDDDDDDNHNHNHNDETHYNIHLVTSPPVDSVAPPWRSRLLQTLSRHSRNSFTQILHALLLALPESSHTLSSRKRRENLVFVTAVSLIFFLAAVILALTTIPPHRSTLLRASLPLVTIPMVTWTTASVTATTTSLSVCILWFAIAASRATSIIVLAWTATIPVVASRTCGLRGGVGAAVVVAACVLQVDVAAIGVVTVLNFVTIFVGLLLVLCGTIYVGSLLERGQIDHAQPWKIHPTDTDAQVPDVRWTGGGL